MGYEVSSRCGEADHGMPSVAPSLDRGLIGLEGCLAVVQHQQGIHGAAGPIEHLLSLDPCAQGGAGGIPVTFSSCPTTDTTDRDHAAALEHARPLTLLTRAASPEAHALVAALVALVEQREAAAGEPVRRGPGLRKGLTLAVEAMAGGLLMLVAVQGTTAWCRQLMRAAAFTGGGFGYRHAAAVMDALRGKPAFVLWHPSLARFLGEKGDRLGVIRRSARYRPSPALVALAEAHGLPLADMGRHWREDEATTVAAPVVMRELGGRVGHLKLTGANLPMPKGPDAIAISDDVLAANAFLATFTFDGCPCPVLFRRFTRDLRHHGRWYGGVADMRRGDRKLVTIDGEAVSELDVGASHLTILHGLAGLSLPAGDLYGGLPFPREVVKAWVTACVGNAGQVSRWPVEASKRAAEPRGGVPGFSLKGFNAKVVGAAVLARYPFLAHLPQLLSCQTEPRLTPHRVMALEAEAITEAMRSLRPQGIPALPIHDALMVRTSDSEAGRQALVEAYQAGTGIRPVVR